MLNKLGITQLAYDYRAEHIPTFDAEIEALKSHHINLFAWWFPTVLNEEARQILAVIEKHRVTPQLWVTGGGEPPRDAAGQKTKIREEAIRIRPIAEAAARLNCVVALYNHGGWFGEPENQLAIIESLSQEGITNVGIVYNLHHGHEHLDRLPILLQKMKPHLLAFNLNGMDPGAGNTERKIIPVGHGERDLEVLKMLVASGWRGPIGILNHTDEDAEARLQDNLEGLRWAVGQINGDPKTPPPPCKSWKDYWGLEDAAEREKLPLYQTIPAAEDHELTPANGWPKRETYLGWNRSHGDNGGTRYSALNQINRQNVTNLQVAWTYHSNDGMDNIQCNPIVVDGLMYAPTPGRFIAAVNAETGVEVWRFKPAGRPAFRGLLYWKGTAEAPPQVMFSAGPYLYALDPKTGKPIEKFGPGGRVRLPGNAQGDFGAATAAPATFEQIIVVPGFEKDVWGFDITSGKQLWTFHTVPQPGEFGADTWDHPESYGANCWGGMAMDDVRGIAFVTTGGPKPNFIGVGHLGQNLFANCLIALDARTGKRLWHFQEIRHDIWDLDIPAPPNLGTITRNGKRIDVVTAVTKIGNTLLIDRTSGKPIFPFRLRRAPASDLRGEQTWPYQPDPELPEPFSKQEYREEDLTTRTEEAADNVLTRFKSATTGFFRPCTEGRANLFFGIDGGAEWTGACIDQESGKLYVTANHIGWLISLFRNDDPPDDLSLPPTPGRLVYEQTCAQCHATNRLGISVAPPLRGVRQRLTDEAVINQIRNGKNGMPAHPNLTDSDVKSLLDYLMLRDRPLPPPGPRPERPQYNSSGYPKFYDYEGYPANKPPWGSLNCVDLNTGKLVWKKNFGSDFGGKCMSDWGYSESPLVDGNLLVCVPGAADAGIVALNKQTGELIWKSEIPNLGRKGQDGAGYTGVVISQGAGVKQYVTLMGRGLVGVRASDGKFLWGYNKIANGTAETSPRHSSKATTFSVPAATATVAARCSTSRRLAMA
jgi:quinoprotein glucose dehydrogenase